MNSLIRRAGRRPALRAPLAPSRRAWPVACALLGLAALLIPAAARAQAGDPILDAAEAYAAYRSDMAALGRAQIDTTADLDQVLDAAASHNRDALSRGWIAYGALTAARSSAFAAGIGSVVRRYGRTAVLRALTRDPYYPSRRRGYGEAIALILAASAAETVSAENAANRLESAASRPHIWPEAGAAENRAARLHTLGAAAFVSRAETRDSVLALTFAEPDHTLRLAPAHAGTARRMASLAAMRILNAQGDWRLHMQRMLNDEPTRSCIELEQLQFYQCVGAAHVVDETASCLSRHALRGVGACMGALADRG